MHDVPLQSEERYIESSGWSLHLKRSVAVGRFRPMSRPLLLIPGFAMNKFILGYHPTGASMTAHLAQAGFEVWALDMRGQGPSRRLDERALEPSIYAYAQLDIQRAIEHVLEHTACTADRVDLIGSSLGGSLVYAHLALRPRSHRVGAAVTLGAPLNWDSRHLLLELLSRLPALLGAVDLRGREELFRRVLPVFASLPVMDLYINRRHFALSDAPKLLQTLTFSSPSLNREMAQWLRHRSLQVHGVEVGPVLRELDLPLLAFVANRDGLVPGPAVRSVGRYWDAARLRFIEVGSDEDWYAHADMFIAPEAPQRVFEPMAEWLRAQQV